MKKKEWVRPRAVVQEFVPNEYIAACGDSGTVYNFECDASGGTLYYYPKGDGKIDGIYNGDERAIELGSYHPCGATHEADSTSGFYDGYVQTRRKKIPVIVWRGRYGRNGHATTNLDMSTWETAKS